jgi:SNF2 family DNA or RNA helicase
MDNWLAYTTIKPYEYQERAFNHLIKQNSNALFSDPGTGKTKMAIDINCARIVQGKINTVIVFAWPSQIHHQWVEEQLPKHWWKTLTVKTNSWNSKKLPAWAFERPENGNTHFITFNIESIVSDKVYEPLLELTKKFGNRISLIVDESQTIKNKSSVRWKRLTEVGRHCAFRTVMTGTPIAKNLMDSWAQYCFLDEKIIGIKYKTAFLQQYCVMGGFNNREVIGVRNLEQFNRLVAPYTFRASKSELGLPEKMPPDEIVFNMTQEQRMAQETLKAMMVLEFDQLRKNFDSNLPMGELLRVSNVGSLFVKLQQIVSGFMIDNDQNLHLFKENPRLDIVDDVLSLRDDKHVIWCRFRKDIELIKQRFGDKAVVYYGGVSNEEKSEAKRKFLNDDRTRYFVANPASAGAGMDGLQTVCSRAMYYTNSFKLLDRIQSEDRINRIGSREPAMYDDIICRASIDRFILQNIRRKRDFQHLALNDLETMIKELI